ncbi:MAG: glycerophosphodiester phosphodiesterase family protein [Anaerovoracaceae bacterium]|jgi:glycerophosphoryl diester phosphodiesterase
MSHLETSWLTCRPIAHRGLHDEKYPENSIPAFKAAIEFNYPIELDVQISADDVIIVFHDFNTYRMTGINRNIKNINSTELSSFILSETEYSIPTFEQVLQIVNGKVPLLIDIKGVGKPGRLEKILCSRLKRYKGEFAIQSFNPFSIWAVKRMCPNFITGQVYKSLNGERLIKKLLFKNCRLNFLSKPNFIAYRLNDNPTKLIKTAKSKGLIVCCWTIKTKEDQVKALRYCDNYIFEVIRP